jgi:hypothetical protein
VLTLKDLGASPELGLTVLTGGDRAVDRALILSGVEAIGADIGHALIVADPGCLTQPERLLGALAAGGAAGLALSGTSPGHPLLGQLHDVADRHGLPLLISSRPTADWTDDLASHVTDLGTELVRREHARLTRLLDQLPAPDTDERDTVRRLTAFLADELDAEVVVSTDGGVIAAAPAGAPDTLAPVLVHPGRSHQLTSRGHYAQTIPLTGNGDATLVVATKNPTGTPEQGLAAYTAKALTLTLAGFRERHSEAAVGDAIREVRLSAFQLLMTGNTVPAQRVMEGVSPGLLDSDTARVFIVDCAGAARDAVMAEAERTLDDEVLMVRCPAFHGHIIVVAPQSADKDPTTDLHRLLDTFAEGRVLLGGSLVHPLDGVADAYGEALDSLPRAGHSPDRVAMASRTTGVIDVLDPGAARAWASELLRPVLLMPRGGRQHLETTAMAVEFEISAAARIIGVHRNTVARRVRQTFEAVGLNQDLVLDRVVLSVAAQAVGRHGADLGGAGRDADAAPVPDLHALLCVPPVQAWAVKALRPLAADRRDLLRTLRSWTYRGCRVEDAAADLGIAPKTVRAHIRASEQLLERDLITGVAEQDAPDESEHRLASIRPLAFALYATTPAGTPRPPLATGHPPIARNDPHA